MKHLPLTLNPRLFALLTFGFVLATIIGTVSHEGGHYVVSKALGYDAYISYASSGTKSGISEREMAVFDSLYKADKVKIHAKEDSPEKKHYLQYREQLSGKFKERPKQHSLLIVLGGPVQTMLTGMLGFWLLWRWRKKGVLINPLKAKHWIGVLLAFFWSRQVFNFVMSIGEFCSCTELKSDEPRISRYFGWPDSSFGLATFIPAVVILWWVVFKAIPKQQRFTFLLSGLAGSAFGWFIWMHWLGPRLLP